MKIKKKQSTEYILCFRDFTDKDKERLPCVFVRITNTSGDKKKEIFRFFNKDGNGTKLIRQLYNTDKGYWRCISIEKINRVPKTIFSKYEGGD